MTIRLFLVCLVLTACYGCGSRANTAPAVEAAGEGESRYVVVSFVPADDPFTQAADALSKRHRARRMLASPDQLETLLPKLRALQPDYVALVVRPDMLDINLVNRTLTMATRIDEDPFVDFAYGFITGRDAEAAVKLVKASKPKESHEHPRIGQLGVGSSQMPRSVKQNAAWPLRNGSIPVTMRISRGDTDETRDEAFIKDALQELDKTPILLLSSHGYPDGLVGGPKAGDLTGRDFSGSIAMNIACYNGVTGTWFEDDWSAAKVQRRQVAPDDSFCLKMIDTGVAGYIAYASPRPAGPTMMGDALLVASSGQSIGELWRQHLNSVVLAHLVSGADRLVASPIDDGDALNRQRTPAETVLKMSTGGMLIGDPAFRRFEKRDDSDPRVTAVTRQGDDIRVDVRITTSTFHFFAGEPINYWNDRDPAMRLETVIEIGDKQVKSVKLLKSNLGDAPHRLAAAIETHGNQRLLRMKAIVAQPGMLQLRLLSMTGLTGTFEIRMADAVDADQQQRVFRGSSVE